MDSLNNICFKRSEFTLYLVVIICIVAYFIYIVYYQYNETPTPTILNLKEINSKISTLQSQIQTQSDQARIQQRNESLLNRIYNPLTAPERSYPGGRLGLHSPNTFGNYQQIGFVYNDEERYPLYGRPKYPRKLDKFEYYIIDETRNHLKIPYKSQGDNEIYDGDQIFIDVFNKSFNVKIYDYDNIRYNPDIY